MTDRKPDHSNDLTDAEMEELLDHPESPEEKALLDKLVADAEEILRRVRARVAREMAGGDDPKP